MNKRRKVGSTLFLSTLAALSIVGMGLAATTALASGSAEFGIIFEDNTTHTNGSVTVAEGSKDATLKVTMNDGGTSVAFSEAILFEYTPETPLDLVNNDLILNWDASLPAGFDTYFNVANTSGKLSPDDASSLAEPTTYTFTLPVDALGVTVKEEADLAAAEEALKDSKIGISYEVNLEEKQEAPVVEVTSVSLDKEALTLAPGASETLVATIAPEDASDKSLTWSSSDDKVATVDNNGKVTAAENAADDATATITVASKNGKSASCVVTIDALEPEPVVSSIALDKDTVNLTVGEGTDTLTATITMDPAGSTAPAVEWSFSENYESYISVAGTDTNTITITPVAEGSVTVTATAGGKTDTATINVKAAPVVEEPAIFEQGKFGLFQSTLGKALYFNGNIANNYYLGTTENYEEAVDVIAYVAGENEYNLRIGENGQYIAAVQSGTHENIVLQDEAYAWSYNEDYDAYYTTFDETDFWLGSYSEKTTIGLSDWKFIDGEGQNIAHIVSEAIPSPALETITISGAKSVAVDSTITLTATANPLGASLAGLTWTSLNTNIATVDSSTGVVTGLKAGETTIKAMVGEVSATYDIEVVEPVTGETTEIQASYEDGWEGFTLKGTQSGSPFSDKGDTTAIASELNSGGETIVSTVDTTENVYTDKTASGVKFGTSSNSGTLSFTATHSISKITIKAVAWSGDTPKITVNDVEKDFSKAGDGLLTSAETFEFDFTVPTDKVTIVSSKKSKGRFAIVGITISYIA